MALISVSLALSQTPVYTARPTTDMGLVQRAVRLFAFRCYSARLPTVGWMARPS